MKIKRIKIVAFLLLFCACVYAQEPKGIILEIDDEVIYTTEFVRMYEKQQELIGIDDENGLESYFDLFVDYKLKVKEARDLKLDTFTTYKKELAAYRNRLIQPYLKDEEANEYLIHEAYQRTVNEVNASHILIKLPSNPTPTDTLKAYLRITEARNKVLAGNDFGKVAKNYSEDPSVAANAGNLGYFTAFNMLYSFENAAYTTLVGNVSEPFRTKYGYHIVQTHAIRKSKGKREIAHIMLKGDENVVVKQIDSLYQLLLNEPKKFSILAAEFSADVASAENGGSIGEIGVGDTIEAFENVAFELMSEGDFSKPVKTAYGWHIIKLIKNIPVPTEEELYGSLKRKVLSDSRASLVNTKLIHKLEATYKIREYKEQVSQVVSGDWNVSKEQRKATILSINNIDYSLEEFIVFLKHSKSNVKTDRYKAFKESKIIDYYKSNLETTNAEFNATISEFKEGLLLFNLMEREIWNPSKKVEAQKDFYSKNKNNYNKPFQEVQGQVIADYQTFLEIEWLKSLKQKHTIIVNSKELSNL